MSENAVSLSMADALQEGHAIDRHVIARELHNLVRRLTEVERERDALKKDAERYRWMRDFGDDFDTAVEDAVMLHDHILRGEDLDAAIDAAMAAHSARDHHG